MSKYFEIKQEVNKICRRITNDLSALKNNFSNLTLHYLDEQIINHLLDSLSADKLLENNRQGFHDYSFLTAPAYKAKVDKHIDKLIKELSENTQQHSNLSKYEKQDIKDRIKEMKGFLQHYRNTPSHYFGEPIDKIDIAHRNIMIIYGAIDNTTQILLKAKLIQIKEGVH